VCIISSALLAFNHQQIFFREKLIDRIDKIRIGFCDVASPTNSRSLIAAIIPANTVSGHKVPTITFEGGDVRDLLLWTGVANSLSIDFLVRKKIALTVSYTIMDSLPFPRDVSVVSGADAIIKKVFRLCAVGDDMEELRQAAVRDGVVPASVRVEEDPDHRARLERLIHSIEVGCIGQLLGSLVGAALIERSSLPATRWEFASLVKAACLAHDIGHPPFGHAGEEAVRGWVSKRAERDPELTSLPPDQLNDPLQFEGNAQGFRILTKLENHLGDGGLQLTYATLGTGMKYPWGVAAERNGTRKKFGFFQSEKAYANEVAGELGLIPEVGGGWCRHPLAYLVEAADDICYAIIDLEDGIDMGSFTFGEFNELLKPLLADSPWEHHSEYAHIADIEALKIGYLRGRTIMLLANECVEEFLKHEEELLAGSYKGSLIEKVPHGYVVAGAKEIGRDRVYHHPRKQYAEIAAFEIIEGLLDEFRDALIDVQRNGTEASFKSRRMHRLMGDRHTNLALTTYESFMGVCDFVSGMTDRFALGMYRQVKGIALGRMTPTP
jgi:dGTPase